MDFCIKTKMENSEMITSNPIKKIIQLTSMFHESQWFGSHIKIGLIHQFILAI